MCGRKLAVPISARLVIHVIVVRLLVMAVSRGLGQDLHIERQDQANMS